MTSLLNTKQAEAKAEAAKKEAAEAAEEARRRDEAGRCKNCHKEVAGIMMAKRCARCGVTAYCSPQCQKQDRR